MDIYEFGHTDSLIDVVVPTADIRGRWFPRCLESVKVAARGRALIVAVESSGPDFNFARSINAGMQRTTGHALILNDDATLEAGACDALLGAIQRTGDGVYQLFIHHPNGKPAEIGWYLDRSFLAPLRYAWRIRGPFATLRKLKNKRFYPFLPLRTPRDGFDGFTFVACLVTRNAWDAVGPLDEGFPLGWEDVDYSLRCHEAGIAYYAVPKAVAFHTINGTRTSGDPREGPSYESLARKWPRERMIRALETGPRGGVVD